MNPTNQVWCPQINKLFPYNLIHQNRNTTWSHLGGNLGVILGVILGEILGVILKVIFEVAEMRVKTNTSY